MRRMFFWGAILMGGIACAGMIKGKEWTANGYKFFTGWAFRGQSIGSPMRVSLIDSKRGYRTSVVTGKDGFFCLVGREDGEYLISVQPYEYRGYLVSPYVQYSTLTQTYLDPFEYLESKGEALSWVRSTDGYVHSVSLGTEIIWQGTDTTPAKGTKRWRFVGPKNGSVTIQYPSAIFKIEKNRSIYNEQ